jgi:hypothetical protein
MQCAPVALILDFKVLAEARLGRLVRAVSPRRVSGDSPGERRPEQGSVESSRDRLSIVHFRLATAQRLVLRTDAPGRKRWFLRRNALAAPSARLLAHAYEIPARDHDSPAYVF